MARYCAEIRPLVAERRFLTGPDMGTSEEDFAPLREYDAMPAAIRTAVLDGLAFEDILTGYGVAREVARRGGRVVAVSTVTGCVMDPSGLDVGRLLELRRAYGYDCIARYGLPLHPAARLYACAGADVLIPGARPGVLTRQVAELVPPTISVVAPAANVPYTSAGAAALHRRGIGALPEFVCNAGAAIGYGLPGQANAQQILSEVSSRISELTRLALGHHAGPLAGAVEQAAAFLRGWRGEAPGPPLAREILSRGRLLGATISARSQVASQDRSGPGSAA